MLGKGAKSESSVLMRGHAYWSMSIFILAHVRLVLIVFLVSQVETDRRARSSRVLWKVLLSLNRGF